MVEPAPGTPAALVRGFLANLMKAALTADDTRSQAWRQKAKHLRQQMLAVPTGLENLKIDGLWWLAVGDAEAPELQSEEKMIEWGQRSCPSMRWKFGVDLERPSVGRPAVELL